MSSSNNNVQDRRANFLDKVEKEGKPEEKDPNMNSDHSSSTGKPRGAGFLEPSSEQTRRVVERKAPSCGYRGG